MTAIAVPGPIESFVPHRATMLLIDRLVEAGAQHAVAELTVPFDGLFVDGGQVPAWVGLEYMAQTISAWSGATHAAAGEADETAAPRLGLLLGTRRYEARVPHFDAGDTLRIAVRLEHRADNGLGLFDCTISRGDDDLATARLSIYEPRERGDLLRGRID